MAKWGSGEVGGGKGRGHLRVTVGHPRVTLGHLRATMGHLRLTL